MARLPSAVYLVVARREFLRDTGCEYPEQAIERGIRTLRQWLDALDAARNEFSVGEYTLKRTVVPDPFRHIGVKPRRSTSDAKREKREALQAEQMERVHQRRQAKLSQPQARSKL